MYVYPEFRILHMNNPSNFIVTLGLAVILCKVFVSIVLRPKRITQFIGNQLRICRPKQNNIFGEYRCSSTEM